jgi:hypothetical protein
MPSSWWQLGSMTSPRRSVSSLVTSLRISLVLRVRQDQCLLAVVDQQGSIVLSSPSKWSSAGLRESTAPLNPFERDSSRPNSNHGRCC